MSWHYLREQEEAFWGELWEASEEDQKPPLHDVMGIPMLAGPTVAQFSGSVVV